GDVHHVAHADRARVADDRLPGHAGGDVHPGHAATIARPRKAGTRTRVPLRPEEAGRGSAWARGWARGSRWGPCRGSARAWARRAAPDRAARGAWAAWGRRGSGAFGTCTSLGARRPGRGSEP